MLKFLLILLIVYFAFVILFRYIFPFILKKIFKRVQKNLFEQNEKYQEQHQQFKKEGEINVDFIPTKPKTNTNNVGEYVDYEELV